MNYGAIKKIDVANGPGVRVSLFVSGCRNHCRGCFNPETWDFNYGQPFTWKTEDEILKALSPEWIQGLSILGGEPLEAENRKRLLPFVKRVRAILPEKDIWLYTGFVYESIQDEEIMKYVDVVVDGPFVEKEKDPRLAFRGSRNQRIIHLKRPAEMEHRNENS